MWYDNDTFRKHIQMFKPVILMRPLDVQGCIVSYPSDINGISNNAYLHVKLQTRNNNIAFSK